MASPCPCRGCTKAYEAGLTDQKWAEHAYEQGWEHGYKHGYDDGMTAGYREGYNDHARSRAYAEQVYGPYKTGPISESDPLPDSPAGPWPALEVWNQHGKGENP